MRILASLTYYRPYTSGLTIYAERLAKALTSKSHEVSVLCMQHDGTLPLEENDQGVRVIRAPALFRISKGFISVKFLLLGIREVKKSDVVHLHLPQFEGAFLALLAVVYKKPLVLTYHCDLIMPAGFLNQLAQSAVWLMNKLTAAFADKMITYTEDFANNSVFLRKYREKVEVVLPPVILPDSSEPQRTALAARADIQGRQPVIGMAARLAAEKGVEVLVDAVRILSNSFPGIKVLFAGPYENVVGEHEYRQQVMPKIEELSRKGAWHFLGNLSPAEMSAYYPLLDVLVVPSLNSTESFGLVQIEAMKCGVPVVSSDLPGVRQPVKISGMGKVVPIGDAKALAEAIMSLLSEKEDYTEKAAKLSGLFDPHVTAENYERVFRSVANLVKR